MHALVLHLQLSPYGPEDGRMSPISPQSSPCSSPASPTLASLQSSGGYFGSSPTRHSYMGMSPTVSPNPSPTVAGSGGFGLSQSYGEPPRKIFPEVAFEDLSASFKNLYKSVFDASHGGENFGMISLKAWMLFLRSFKFIFVVCNFYFHNVSFSLMISCWPRLCLGRIAWWVLTQKIMV